MAAWTYTCWDDTGRVIYVGATRNLSGRLTDHGRISWWAPQVAKVKAKVYPTYTDALTAEKALIREHLPRWNVTGKWATRHRWTDEDYRDYRTAIVNGNQGRPLTDWQRSHLDTLDRAYGHYRDAQSEQVPA